MGKKTVRVRRIPGKTSNEPLPRDKKVSTLLSSLGINRETVVVRISGKIVPESAKLSGKETVEIVSIISGG